MAKVSLADHMKERDASGEQEQVGPFVTISRAFGCYGFSLGLLLMEILNDNVEPGAVWRIYHREILERLATETNMATELLEQQRRTRPSLLVDFFRSLSKDRRPSGQEVRRRIAAIVRELATEGRAIIIGQGGTAATLDLPNRMSVRLEAPIDWRIKEVAFREGLSEIKARMRIQAMDREREYLRELYTSRTQNNPSFNLIYDCSTFTLAQIAQHIVYGMRLRGLI